MKLGSKTGLTIQRCTVFEKSWNCTIARRLLITFSTENMMERCWDLRGVGPRRVTLDVNFGLSLFFFIACFCVSRF